MAAENSALPTQEKAYILKYIKAEKVVILFHKYFIYIYFFF